MPAAMTGTWRCCLERPRVDIQADPVLATQVPGCLVFLGNGTEPGAGGVPLHSHDYVFNDSILGSGVDFYVELARDALG